MWTSLAARPALVLGRAAGPLRKTVRILPRALFLRNGGVTAVRPMTVSALMRAPTATAKKTKPKASAAKKKKATTTTTKAAKKKPASKTKAKPKAKKAVKKKKKVVAKKKPVKKTARTKKPLTEEQKERRELSTLRKMSLLKGPNQKPPSAWTIYLAQNIRKGEGDITKQVSEISTAFKELSIDQREDLDIAAESNKAENERIIHDWVRSHPVEAIYVANKARKRLARKTGKTGVRLITDDRLPARSLNAYALFFKINFSKADDESNSQAFKRLAERWNSLSDEQKSPYQEQAAADAVKSAVQFTDLREKAKIYWKANA